MRCHLALSHYLVASVRRHRPFHQCLVRVGIGGFIVRVARFMGVLRPCARNENSSGVWHSRRTVVVDSGFLTYRYTHRGSGGEPCFMLWVFLLGLNVCCFLAGASSSSAESLVNGFNGHLSPLSTAFRAAWLNATNTRPPSGKKPITCVLQKPFSCVGAEQGDCSAQGSGGDVKWCDARCVNNGNEGACIFP